MDKHYLGQRYQLSELEHRYGKNIHILSNPVLFSYLATLCSPETKQPSINALMKILYDQLIPIVVNQEFAKKPGRTVTRMAKIHPQEGAFTSDLIDREQQVVCVNLARAGTYPSHICYESLNYLLNPDQIRQDHILMSRVTDESNKVLGTAAGGYKIGGPVDNAIVLFPDPMGATGSTIIKALNEYKGSFGGSLKMGKAKKYIALHLIVTPEYLKNIQKHHSDLIVYALRLDRGLSRPDVLQSALGEFWDEEKGLNQEQYIVPGGGGFGEILNNAYV
ncbi:MAG: uracil phosphoribosyltransferase [Oligoflexia bacterium]|nr:uracil phosphoribosyltransferase [Oligoflexia bacterium]